MHTFIIMNLSKEFYIQAIQKNIPIVLDNAHVNRSKGLKYL